MLKLKHNKKRNVGLITEFISRNMSKSIVLKQDEQLEEAKKIWVKYFSKNTELSKEYRLFAALYETTVKNKETAASLLQIVREHSRKQDAVKLEKEKTALIQEINASKLNEDKSFFDCEVSDYKNLATIQILLNSWRDNNLSEIANVAALEDKLLEHLIAGPTSPSEALNENNQPEVLGTRDEDLDALVVTIMTEKFNRKYENVLTEDQKDIINAYVFSQTDASQKQKLSALLNEQRMQALSFVEYEIKTTTDARNQAKLKKIKGLLEENNIDHINDDVITFYVHVCKLKNELKEGKVGPQ